MKYTKIESLGALFLFFSLPAPPSDPPSFVRRSELWADAVLLLTPSLTADLRLDAYTRRGTPIPAAECLPALGAYLLAAGLPLYSYEIETTDGVLLLDIPRKAPPRFRFFCDKSKALFTKAHISCRNAEYTVDVIEAGDRYAVLFCDSAGNADLAALLPALAFSEAGAVSGMLALSPREGGYEVRYLLQGGGARVPLAPLAAAARRLFSLGKGCAPFGTELFLPQGCVRAEDGGGGIFLLVPARLLSRGEYGGEIGEKNSKKTHKVREK